MEGESRVDRLNFQSLIGISNIDDIVDYAASVINNNGVVLTPTDTVYGLICSPHSRSAINTVFDMKQRPSNWRLPIIVSGREQAKTDLPLIWNESANLLSLTFWPGALTLACGIADNNLDWLVGRDEVGVRVPDYPFIQKLANKIGPFLMTSANRHGTETAHTVEGALKSLVSHPTLVLDGGLLSGAPSTLVNVNLPVPAIERSGSIPDSAIRRVLKNVK